MIAEPLYMHRSKLQAKLSGEMSDYYQQEVTLLDDVIAAPNRPFKTNYVVDDSQKE